MPLGIFALNNGIAINCINILKEQGMLIGKEVAVIGFDNTTESEYLNANLTTVAQNGLLLRKSAADIVIDKIEGKTS